MIFTFEPYAFFLGIVTGLLLIAIVVGVLLLKK